MFLNCRDCQRGEEGEGVSGITSFEVSTGGLTFSSPCPST